MRYGLADNDYPPSNETSFPVQSSVLDEEALFTRIVQDYRIPTPVACRFLSRGDADIYRVKTAAANFYLKVYRPPQSLEMTEAEASFVSSLFAAGIPTVKPILRSDGRFACQVSAPEGLRPMLLYEEAPPALPAQLDEALLSQIGEKVASFHAVVDEFQTDFGIHEIQSEVFLREQIYYIQPFLTKPDGTFLDDVSKQLDQILKGLPKKKPHFGLCHADLVLSNLRLTPEGNIALFDFGNALKTWRVYELATIYWSLARRFRDSLDLLWRAFLEGYESTRSLPEAISQLLPVMIVLRQISFLGGNCATLPLRLGTEPFESGFIEEGMKQLRKFVEESEMQNLV